jgi:phosphoglycolate phosphatase
MRPEAILLDWDNTLVENWECIHEAMIETLRAMGRPPWSIEETRRRARRSLRDSFPELFGEQWKKARGIFYERFTASHLKGLRALPRAEELLVGLSGCGIFLAVVSNKSGGYLRSEAAHLGWTRFFGAIIGATDAEEDKPAVAPVDLALAGSGVARGPDVWLVGDGAVDMECAHRAGCVPVLLREQPPAEAEFGSNSPRFHVRSCAELAAVVGSLSTAGPGPGPGSGGSPGEFG